MNKKWYRSSLAKVLLIGVFHGALALVAVCGLFLVAMEANGIRVWGDHGNSYIETEGFVDSLEVSATNILSGLNAQKLYEEPAFGEKVMDLKEVLEGREITYENHSGLAYSLKDLKAWVKQSWEQANYGAGEAILVCICEDSEEIYYYYYEDVLRMVEDGTFVFELGDTRGMSKKEMAAEILNSIRYGTYEYEMYDDAVLSIEDKVRNVKYSYVECYDGEWVREEYAPVGADTLLDAVNESPQWKGRLNEAFIALQESLRTVSAYYETEEKLKSYEEGNTNLTYLYVDLDKKEILTNNRADGFSFGNHEEALMEMSGQEAYIILKPKLADCETNLDLERNDSLQMWHHMAYNQIDAENYIFAVSVDGSFPVADSFAEADKIYRKYASRRTPAVQGMIFGALLLMVSLIWLTAAAGKRPGDEEVHLNAFDRIFTEIAAVGVFGVWAVCMTVPARILETELDFDTGAGMLLVVGSVFFTAAMFLLGYLSLVRRIKGRILWKNSFLRWCLGLMKKLWQKARAVLEMFSRNTPGKIKVTLLTCGFVMLQFLGFVLVIDAEGIFLLPLAALDCWALIYMIKKADGNDRILDGVKRISGGELQYKIPSEKLTGNQKQMAEYINHIGEGLDAAVENSLKNERMKTELITNVSHDIKTPLTSIINYVDLLKRENFTDPKVCGYLDVLESKAQRLKVLTEDVVEASKASAGTITLDMRELDFSEMLYQVMGEFEERFEERNLTLMVHLTQEPVVIRADGQRLWRVLDNVFHNVVKYALEGTRVYVQTTPEKGRVVFSLKNISAQPLNISPEELTERFIRGDVSRNTEGSGLGLSIAKSLTELQGGDFRLYLDGDLFKVIITFPLVTKKEK